MMITLMTSGRDSAILKKIPGGSEVVRVAISLVSVVIRPGAELVDAVKYLKNLWPLIISSVNVTRFASMYSVQGSFRCLSAVLIALGAASLRTA